jgi:hypothetical protein
MKSNQSNRYYIEISRVLSDGKAYTPTYILSQVERQPKWNDVKAVLNTMIDDEIVVWNDDQTKLFIPTSAKRS